LSAFRTERTCWQPACHACGATPFAFEFCRDWHKTDGAVELQGVWRGIQFDRFIGGEGGLDVGAGRFPERLGDALAQPLWMDEQSIPSRTGVGMSRKPTISSAANDPAA